MCVGIFCEVELAHWQTIDAENWNMDTNSHNDDMREHVLSVMRCLEAHVNKNEGINIPSPLQTPRIEEDHFVSTVTFIPSGHLYFQRVPALNIHALWN